MIVDGIRWWTTGQAVDQLGIARKTLNQWIRRSKLAGHTTPATSCPTCAGARPRFPHVDPPRVRGRLAAYNADQLLAAEAHTAGACAPGESYDRAVFDEVDALSWR